MGTIIDRILSPLRGKHTAPVAHAASIKPPTPNTVSRTYVERTKQLSEMYQGTAEWGTPIARNVIDVRAAFTLAGGVRAVPGETTKEADAQRELDFIERFLDFNGLREDLPQDWAKEAEIEGKFLATLRTNMETGDVAARYFSYTSCTYTVVAAAEDYAKYDLVKYKDSNGIEKTIKPHLFVYRPFGGRTHNVNDTPSKAASVVWSFEALHKALHDWRQANRLFASPTPYFKCANPAEVNALLDKLKEINWKIGQFLAGTADYILVGMPTTGIQSLKDEITSNAQIISGNTGVPVHFLGFPELMSNRSTADTLFDMVAASTHRERRIWESFYTELFDKAIELANAELKTGLRPGLVQAQIPEHSSKTMLELKEDWLPLYEANALSLETLLSKVPNIDDPAAEIERINAASAVRAQAALATIRAAGANEDPENEREGE